MSCSGNVAVLAVEKAVGRVDGIVAVSAHSYHAYVVPVGIAGAVYVGLATSSQKGVIVGHVGWVQ